MSETHNQLNIGAAVPVHPKPMAEGGGLLARMEGNRRCDRFHFSSLAFTEIKMLTIIIRSLVHNQKFVIINSQL
jgi:hypothetical protein